MNRYLTAFLFFVLSYFCIDFVRAEHELLRRLAVFPPKVASGGEELSTEAWWKIREQLTNNERFLVASRNFLKKKDVLQQRGELQAADAIILGRLLDAQAIVVTYLEKRKLNMVVYDGGVGLKLWENEILLHPSIPMSDQLVNGVEKLTKDFLASVPYQGFVLKDELIGETLYKRNDQFYFQIQVDQGFELKERDIIEIISVEAQNLKPLFLGGSKVDVLAEAEVLEVRSKKVVARVTRAIDLDRIRLGSLVRVPKSQAKVRDLFLTSKSLDKRINPEFYSLEVSEQDEKKRELKPLITSLSFIANIAAFLFLAF